MEILNIIAEIFGALFSSGISHTTNENKNNELDSKKDIEFKSDGTWHKK